MSKKASSRELSKTHYFGFTGMDNLRVTGEYQLDDQSTGWKRRITPRIVLNADVINGKIVPRAGHQKILSLSQCHSLWKGSKTLCIATGSNNKPALFQFAGDTVTEICEVEGSGPMFYAEAENRIYLSNGFWKKTYDGASVVDWGLALPPMPVAVPCEGSLPPGRYDMCYTYQDGSRIGGNGSILSVEWDGGESGLELLNLPTNALFWLSQPDGDTMYLVTPSANKVTEPYYAQPIPTLGIGQVPYMTNLTAAHGRIWGTRGNYLHYSEPFRYEWFKDSNSEYFPEEIVMLAPFLEGLFVHSRTTSWVVAGTNPKEWQIKRVGDGAIPGTLTFALVEGGGYEISQRFSQLPSPVWMGLHGVIVGTNTGKLVHLTENRLKINHRTEGAALSRFIAGQPQIIMCLRGGCDKVPDVDLQEIFAAGKLH